MRVIICGGRDFTGSSNWEQRVRNALYQLGDVDEVVSGTCRGADKYGEHIATLMDIPIKRFPAQWHLWGKSAGYQRNLQMGEYADAVIALPGGRGTQHMINIAKDFGLEVIQLKETT